MGGLPRATEVLTSGMDRGLHLGAQVCVWHEGAEVADFAVGEARAGVPMTRDSLVTWFSMTKRNSSPSRVRLASRSAHSRTAAADCGKGMV